MSESDKKNKLEKIIENFCREFLDEPYLCYTEHGWHAYFYHFFITRWQEYGNSITAKMPCVKDICIIQKEFPTLSKLIFTTKRQHWDIAILDESGGTTTTVNDLSNKQLKEQESQKLFAAIEFGMNADKNHFDQDLKRLKHKDALGKQFEYGYVVNLVRIGDISGRDRSVNPFSDVPVDDDEKIVVYHVVFDKKSSFFINGNEKL